MKSTWLCGLLIVLLLALSGCFQQAGESLQSTGSTALPIQAAASPTTEGIIPTQSAPATDTPPRLEVITATSAPSSGAPITATLPPITIIVQPTAAPGLNVTDTPTADTSASDTGVASPTSPGFITPSSPLVPGLETATPFPSGGEPTTTPSGLVTPTALSETDLQANFNPDCSYTVQHGDTVYRIAINHNTSVAAMKEANPDLVGDNPVIHPGETLMLPDCGSADVVQVEPSAVPSEVPPVIEPAQLGATPTTAANQETYVVKRGDTLFAIALHYGTTVAAIVEANKLSNPDRLAPGQELIIPGR